MADNDQPNKSKNSRKLNGEPENFLENIGQAYRTSTAKERFEEQRLKELDEARLRKLAEQAEILRAGASTMPNELRQSTEEAISSLEQRQHKYQGRVATYNEVRHERFSQLLSSRTRDAFDPKTGIQMAARTSMAQSSSSQYMNTPYSKLEQDIGSGQQRLRELQELAMKQAPGEISRDPQEVERTRSLMPQYLSERNKIVNTIGSQVAAQRYQKSLGLDPESRLSSLFSSGAAAEKTLFKAGVSERLKEGGNLSSEDTVKLEQRKIELSRELVAALEEFKNATDDATRATTQEKAESKKRELDETQEAISQGGGRGGAGIGRVGRFAATAAMVAGAATHAFENIAIGQTNLITTNRTSAAGVVNDIYSRRMKAAAGDMTQLELLSSNSFQDATSEAFKSRTNKQAANTGGTLTAGLGTVGAIAGGLMAAGAASSLTGIGSVVGVPMMAAGAGLLASSAVMGGLSATATQGTDLVRGGSANREFLDEYSRQVQRSEAEVFVSGQQKQRLYDFSQGMRGVALAAGIGQQASKMDLSTGASNLYGGQEVVNAMEQDGSAFADTVARTGLTPEQYTQYATPAARTQGSAFRLSQVEQAAKYQRSGVADMQTIMGSFTTLAGAGSNNPQASFATVLETAFTKSLNTAESLTRLVDNTAITAQKSVGAAIGMDVTGAAAGTIAALINPDIKNKEFAVNRAATAQENIRAMSTDMSANFESMLGVGDIAKAGKVDFASASVMRRIDPETLNAMTAKVANLKKMEPNSSERTAAEKELAKDLKNAGLTDFTKDDKVNINEFESAAQAKRASIIKNKIPFLVGLSPNTPGYKDLMSGNIGNPEEFIEKNSELTAQINKFGGSAGLGVTAQELMRSIGGATAPTNEAKSDALKMGSGDATGIRKSMNDSAESFGRAASAELKKALEGFSGNFSKAMSNIAENMSKNQDSLLGTDSKKAAEISSDFGDGAKLFNDSVKNFETIINDFGNRFGGQKVVVPSSSPSANNQDKRR